MHLLLPAILVVAGIAAVGWVAARRHEATAQEIAERTLRSIAELKAGQIEGWMRERRGDAAIVQSSAIMLQLLKSPADLESRARVADYFRRLQEAYDYDLLAVFDGRGELVQCTSTNKLNHRSCVASNVHLALQAREVVVTDLHRGRTNEPIHFALLCPMRWGTNAAASADGVGVLMVDPSRFLDPFVQRWPVPSETGEAVLVRREGDEVVVLTEARKQKNTALNLRFSLTRTNLPAVRAVLGETEVMQEVDYRGVPVTAVAHPIRGTAWVFLAKMDQAEIDAPIRKETRRFVLLAGFAGLAVVLGVGLLVRQQRLRIMQAELVERRRVEAALQQSRELLRLVLDTIPQAVFWKDRECTYLGCNKTFALLAGLRDSAEVVGKTDFDLPWQRHESEAYQADDRAVIAGGVAKTHIVETQRAADGVERWVDTSKLPLRDAEGKSIGVLGVYEDITARKRMEEDLRERNEELLRFSYTVSHDLKSPLVTIQTFLGYLEKDLERGDRERVKADFGYINRAAIKMLELLEELLELSRIGRKMNPPEEVPFTALVQAALDAVAGQIAERGVQVDVARTAVVLRGDRVRLTEVFQNLIDNAVKFMGEQTAPRIEVGFEEKDHEFIFFVRDNGAGIDPRHQGKLFGLFEKLHPGTPGNGMGLALVKRIIEVHGGRIWAESAGPGQGATFRFSIQGIKR